MALIWSNQESVIKKFKRFYLDWGAENGSEKFMFDLISPFIMVALGVGALGLAFAEYKFSAQKRLAKA
jgi:hypothetical protein